ISAQQGGRDKQQAKAGQRRGPHDILAKDFLGTLNGALAARQRRVPGMGASLVALGVASRLRSQNASRLRVWTIRSLRKSRQNKRTQPARRPPVPGRLVWREAR